MRDGEKVGVYEFYETRYQGQSVTSESGFVTGRSKGIISF